VRRSHVVSLKGFCKCSGVKAKETPRPLAVERILVARWRSGDQLSRAASWTWTALTQLSRDCRPAQRPTFRHELGGGFRPATRRCTGDVYMAATTLASCPTRGMLRSSRCTTASSQLWLHPSFAHFVLACSLGCTRLDPATV